MKREGRGLTKEDLKWIIPVLILVAVMILISVVVIPGKVHM